MTFGIAQFGVTSEGGGLASPTTFTFSSAQTLGNSNVIFIGNDDQITASSDSVTDNNSNSYVRVAFVNDTVNGIFGGVWWCPSIHAASGGACTVTFSFGGSPNFSEVWCVEVNGGPFALDTAHGSGGISTSGNSSTPSVSYTTGSAPDFLLGYCFSDNFANNDSQGAGWAEVGVGPSGNGSLLQSITATPAGSFTASCTLEAGAKWTQTIIALKQSTSTIIIPQLMMMGIGS